LTNSIANTKTFKCACGKEFINGQQFNGHKSRCKIHHLNKYGNLDIYDKVQSALSNGMSISKKQKAKEKRQTRMQTWVDEKHQCEKCGKIMAVFYGSGRFCSRSCANSKQHSEETKTKISKALKLDVEKKFCKQCGKELCSRNISGYCKVCLRTCDEFHEQRKLSARKVYENSVKNGTFKGWQLRNETPFSEKFFINILNQHKIPYTHNKPVKQSNNRYCYFLDFYIELPDMKLDLEIDGKQHKYPERKEADKRRTAELENLGYTIYRIEWNEVRTEKGKLQLNQKVEDFLNFLYKNGFKKI
jgi:very-short-patch-repair endonuclease